MTLITQPIMHNNWSDTLARLSKSAKKQREAAEKKRQEQRQQQQKQAAEQVDFAKAMADVTPLTSSNRKSREMDRSPIRVRRISESLMDSADTVFVGLEDHHARADKQYRKNGVSKQDLHKLINKKIPLYATLDLHGYGQEETQQVLNEFMAYLVNHRAQAAEIIHGTGLGSQGFVSPIKNLTRRWLKHHPQVLAYAEPPHNDGSVWILVKRQPRQFSEDVWD